VFTLSNLGDFSRFAYKNPTTMAVFEYFLSLQDKSNPNPFNDFIVDHLPSTLRIDDKVIISRSSKTCLPVNLVIDKFKSLSSVVTETAVLDLAAENGLTEGKWMLLYLNKQDFDLKWVDILTSFLKGRLGVKLELFARNDNYMGLFIHTADFRDLEELDMVAEELVRLGLKRGKMYYKPEVYSILGIRNPNHWGLQASIYQVD
jgi:hypothetical protein